VLSIGPLYTYHKQYAIDIHSDIIILFSLLYSRLLMLSASLSTKNKSKSKRKEKRKIKLRKINKFNCI